MVSLFFYGRALVNPYLFVINSINAGDINCTMGFLYILLFVAARPAIGAMSFALATTAAVGIRAFAPTTSFVMKFIVIPIVAMNFMVLMYMALVSLTGIGLDKLPGLLGTNKSSGVDVVVDSQVGQNGIFPFGFYSS